MVAEPFIFLSTDRLVDVRCCMAGDTPLFCVVDFIRRTANRRMGPLDALQYWMDISLRLQNEFDVMNSFVYQFPGPFERPSICLNAKGLLALYHHMEAMHGLVNQAYRPEVEQRLVEVAEGRGRQYIVEYDDGEVDEQMEEGGEVGWGKPVAGSRFWYVPMVKGDDGEEEDTIPTEVAFILKQEENAALLTTIAQKEAELSAARQHMTERDALTNTRIQELEQMLCRKRGRDEAFTLSAAIKSMGLNIQEQGLGSLCKRVVTQFKRAHPEAALDRRQHVVYFPSGYRGDVEHLLGQEFMRMELERVEREHVVGNKSAV